MDSGLELDFFWGGGVGETVFSYSRHRTAGVQRNQSGDIPVGSALRHLLAVIFIILTLIVDLVYAPALSARETLRRPENMTDPIPVFSAPGFLSPQGSMRPRVPEHVCPGVGHWLGMLNLAIVTSLAIFGPWLAPFDPTAELS